MKELLRTLRKEIDNAVTLGRMSDGTADRLDSIIYELNGKLNLYENVIPKIVEMISDMTVKQQEKADKAKDNGLHPYTQGLEFGKLNMLWEIANKLNTITNGLSKD